MNYHGKKLTCREVAEKYGFDDSYVRKLIASGKIRAEKFGYSWAVFESSLKNLKRKSTKKKDEINDAKIAMGL